MDSLLKKDLPLEALMPLIRELLADTVTLSPVSGRLKKYDLPLYQRDNGAYVLHRIVRVEDTYTCVGDNQFDLEHGIQDDQLIGVVSSFAREEKVISVSDVRYRLYCRLWHWSRPIRKYPTKAKRFIRRRLKK